jgi:hypothetical protein
LNNPCIGGGDFLDID